MTPVLVMSLIVILGIVGAILHFWGFLALLGAVVIVLAVLVYTKGDEP